ncbi:MAG: lytic transglycosylase domain-containing protein [Deltaproteobacteria bacterium]
MFACPSIFLRYGLAGLLSVGLLTFAAPAPAEQVLCTDCTGISDCVPVCWKFNNARGGKGYELGRHAPATALHWAGRTRSSPASAADPVLERLIQRIASQAKIDPALVHAVVRAESGFDRFAVSRKGAQGLMQLMPDTAREVGVKNPFIAEQNLQGGVAYLRRMLDLFAGNTRLALAAYNAGPTAVLAHGAVPPFPETRRYVDKVLAFRDEIHARR